MIPKLPLPLASEWDDADSYVESLLSFATSSVLWSNICGGVHILDFLTRQPDIYSTVVPAEWQEFFDGHDISNILDLLMREDIGPLQSKESGNFAANSTSSKWRDGPKPPPSLVKYIHDIRRHCLNREFCQKHRKEDLSRNAAIGMNTKKRHEVGNFSRYVTSLADDVTAARGEEVSHIVDFGSGLNYLGRTLASPPYNKEIIAIERRHNNITSAKGKDVHAKLAKKTLIMRNKKEYRARLLGIDTPESGSDLKPKSSKDLQSEVATVIDPPDTNESIVDNMESLSLGHMHYVEHEIQDGYLEPIIRHILEAESKVSRPQLEEAQLLASRVMVVSLHSCGNLVHHGIRSLIMNPSVVAIAMIGCCYNLMTERLGPMTYKIPILRSLHPRLEKTSKAYDPHGFPMSKYMEDYTCEAGKGMRLNITARMMAVQAPYNWGSEESKAFFTRHFYRSLLQRILVDYEIIPLPGSVQDSETQTNGEVPGTALVVGSLRKSAFASFSTYARAAISRLSRDTKHGESIKEKLGDISDEVLDNYVKKYEQAKKKLSIIWTLMAFSAGVAESMIVTDRWLFLREQDNVKHAWVEPVFEYAQSPRNLVVVGIKR